MQQFAAAPHRRSYLVILGAGITTGRNMLVQHRATCCVHLATMLHNVSFVWPILLNPANPDLTMFYATWCVRLTWALLGREKIILPYLTTSHFCLKGWENVYFFNFPLSSVHGGYSPFSEFSECSVTCGNGVRYRHRSCTSPPPRFGGMDCSRLGNPVETMPCFKRCKELDGGQFRTVDTSLSG